MAPHFEARFQKGAIPDELQEVSLRCPNGELAVAQMLKQAGLVGSTSEALRMIDQGGVKLDGVKVSDRGLMLAAGLTLVAQVGKRKFARVILM